jgi:hypothetical protein
MVMLSSKKHNNHRAPQVVPTSELSNSTVSLEDDFNRWSFERIMEVFHRASPMYWAAREGFPWFLSKLESEYDDAEHGDAVQVWKNGTRDFVWTVNMCTAARDFKLAGSQKKHVAIMHFGENWGAFSGHVPNKTANWAATMNVTFGDCASYDDIMSYLDHPNTHGIVTSQFQCMDHPKVHSIPLGLSDGLKDAPDVDLYYDRTHLLMINFHDSETRKPVSETVIRNFDGSVRNTYGRNDDYLLELSRSKFVLSPSGLGLLSPLGGLDIWGYTRH